MPPCLTAQLFVRHRLKLSQCVCVCVCMCATVQWDDIPDALPGTPPILTDPIKQRLPPISDACTDDQPTGKQLSWVKPFPDLAMPATLLELYRAACLLRVVVPVCPAALPCCRRQHLRAEEEVGCLRNKVDCRGRVVRRHLRPLQGGRDAATGRTTQVQGCGAPRGSLLQAAEGLGQGVHGAAHTSASCRGTAVTVVHFVCCTAA
jgi:hypothetical protein